MQQTQKKVWFPAKKYGWGWGAPCSWQGWVVMAVWLIVLTTGMVAIAPYHRVLAIAFAIAVSSILIAICWIKGEKPRWRWGED